MKKFVPGQNLCSSAFGGNIRPYTKQRAQHRSPFLERPPTPPSPGAHAIPPPAKQFSGRPIPQPCITNSGIVSAAKEVTFGRRQATPQAVAMAMASERAVGTLQWS